MKKVLLFSILLIGGLGVSQFVSSMGGWTPPIADAIRLLTMVALGFIMIHVGYEFDIDRTQVRAYLKDYLVAGTAAAFPWVFCALYFVWVLHPADQWGDGNVWTNSLLAARFAAPTSAGILFAMLAAAGLSATWLFRKARILAIFDDLDTVLLMIPLKMLIVGMKWQLGVIVAIMAILLWAAWKWLHIIRLPITWKWVLGYAAVIAAVSEVIYAASKGINDVVPIHIEVLLPAFVVGCVLARPPGQDPHRDDMREGHQEGPEHADEQKVSTIISAIFMVLVGLSMPAIDLTSDVGLSTLLLHVFLVTVLSNLGKMFPLFCYRDEATRRERLALCIGMWPRGEVGAGVLLVSIGYGIGGTMVTVATLSLALNLLLTGVFIWYVKRLLNNPAKT